MRPNDAHLESILMQCPAHVTLDDVSQAWERHEGDVNNILAEFWNVPNKEGKKVSDVQKKWNEIRDICDSFDAELDRVRKST